jgi:hypothetical protein
MGINADTISRLRAAQERADLYRPNAELRRELGSRSLIMLVAPAAMGKTYLMHALAEADERFGMSTTVSTRSPRPDDDPAMFRLLDHTDANLNYLLDKVDEGKMVQYAIHPSEGTFYGSELDDHPHRYNMLATLSGAVSQLQAVGFGRTTLVGLTSRPEVWQQWFGARYPIGSPKRLGRLSEAEKSYRDLLARDDVNWVINHPGEVELTVDAVINLAEGKPHEDEARAYAVRTLQQIDHAKQLEYTNTYDQPGRTA